MAEITPATFGTQVSPTAPATIVAAPPGIDRTARTERATRAAQDSAKANDRFAREDRVDTARLDQEALQRTEERARNQDEAVRNMERKSMDEDPRQQTMRDKHAVDVRV